LWIHCRNGNPAASFFLESEVNEVQSVAEWAPIGCLMLGLVVIFGVCSICDFIEFGIKRVAEKQGFSDPQLNELMENFRVLGMRGSTYSLVKGIAFAGMLGFTIYAGKPAMSSLIASWFV
jgi:hypothetical protein